MRAAIIIGRKARILEQVSALDGAQHALEEFRRGRHVQGDRLPVGGLERKALRRRVARLAMRGLGGLEILRHGVDGDGGHCLEQRGLDLGAPLPRALEAPDQPGHDADHRDQRRRQVADAGAGKAGVVLVAHDRQETAHAESDGVIGGAVAPRTAISEARDRGIDQVGIDRAGHVGAQPQRRHLARAGVLDQHIEARQQRLDQRDALGALEIDGEALLAGVHLVEIGVLRPLAAAERISAARRFNLDHVGAERREDGAAIGAGDEGAEIEHADTVERSCLAHAPPSPTGRK
ncbi:hypothetical protein R2601_03658 [Salipiger bermudensis HTCC2601]|uniref:Uncharacterized protein n=1 Tax=Salipiger bermudensis (strain DSM 26914 / JCM 13377 / KCTC 12554 / HTCC2601) TaxID=314265 RepID=Q0FWB4_SALBH|nr:hypothetical protein R2601_03658 [Salipiger bermudensis HTCC2601]